MEEVDVGLGTDNIQMISEGMIEVVVGPDRVQELIPIRDRIRCYKCREYDHFAKDSPTLQVEKEAGQIQQMYNMDKEQTMLNVLATNTYDNLNRINSVD